MESARTSPPCVLVIFGASGDLTRRKLLPALQRLASQGRLPAKFVLVGVGRTALSDGEFRRLCATSSGEGAPSDDRWDELMARSQYVAGNYEDPATYSRIAEVLQQSDDAFGTAGNRLYYLATPPKLFGTVPRQLGTSGLSAGSGDGFARLVIEKPFGWDQESARTLYTEISTAFSEQQIFRIDHYLAKETVQNLLALRFANAIFEPMWNRTWVDNVQITVAETVGVGDRGGFYEGAGAVRDIVQNHVLQVLSLLMMEAPASFHPEAIRDEKLKLLRAIQPMDECGDLSLCAVRGQYARGGTRADPMPGYREETGVDPLSSTETFVALRLAINNWRWAGVPIYVRTGKRLPARVTEVAMEFKHPPQLPLFPSGEGALQPDALIVRVQPDEGLSLQFGAKVPGHDFRIRQASMDFRYSTESEGPGAEAYERVLLDALVGDPTLFVRADEVGRAWRIVDPLLEFWAQSLDPIPLYHAASWGPREATEMLTREGRQWRLSG
ncbi:MAG: glucose-6-phosphate dehydrogenase [Actinomycetota bacterium]|nr:glucose-6-phosphate dehydrogenase [Actinomycetota bacterium]